MIWLVLVAHWDNGGGMVEGFILVHRSQFYMHLVSLEIDNMLHDTLLEVDHVESQSPFIACDLSMFVENFKSCLN